MINTNKPCQTKDGVEVRFIGTTPKDHLIWYTTKPTASGNGVFSTDLYGKKNGSGRGQYWDVENAPELIVRYLWLSTAQFMDPPVKVADCKTPPSTAKWYDSRSNIIIRPGSLWFEVTIDTKTGKIINQKEITE